MDVRRQAATSGRKKGSLKADGSEIQPERAAPAGDGREGAGGVFGLSAVGFDASEEGEEIKRA